MITPNDHTESGDNESDNGSRSHYRGFYQETDGGSSLPSGAAELLVCVAGTCGFSYIVW
jgi:hypothetical protein